MLKEIETATAHAYEAHHLSKIEDESLRAQTWAVVLESNMAGLEEFGETWFACIKQKMVRMNLCAEWIGHLLALPSVEDDKHPSGFDPYERHALNPKPQPLK